MKIPEKLKIAWNSENDYVEEIHQIVDFCNSLRDYLEERDDEEYKGFCRNCGWVKMIDHVCVDDDKCTQKTEKNVHSPTTDRKWNPANTQYGKRDTGSFTFIGEDSPTTEVERKEICGATKVQDEGGWKVICQNPKPCPIHDDECLHRDDGSANPKCLKCGKNLSKPSPQPTDMNSKCVHCGKNLNSIGYCVCKTKPTEPVIKKSLTTEPTEPVIKKSLTTEPTEQEDWRATLSKENYTDEWLINFISTTVLHAKEEELARVTKIVGEHFKDEIYTAFLQLTAHLSN